MASIDRDFTIIVDGQPISNPRGDDDRIHAEAGSDAAVFSLRDSRLQSGDWFLGRFAIEDRSLMPKRVYWFKAGSDEEHNIQPVHARQKGESYELRFSDAPLVILDGKLFATLLDEPRQPVQIKLQ
ncbi:hypothetical protein QQZ08_004036 [Neonectria magnoliae]|uniref:Uncharacterized protein n=1 Tax=Neonectria magnoliae TaxID=2732573 RepID=A0ABR1I766_9HYPO